MDRHGWTSQRASGVIDAKTCPCWSDARKTGQSWSPTCSTLVPSVIAIPSVSAAQPLPTFRDARCVQLDCLHPGRPARGPKRASSRCLPADEHDAWPIGPCRQQGCDAPVTATECMCFLGGGGKAGLWRQCSRICRARFPRAGDPSVVVALPHHSPPLVATPGPVACRVVGGWL